MNQIQKWDVVVALIRESAQGSRADDPQFVTNSETIIRLCKEDMHRQSSKGRRLPGIGRADQRRIKRYS